MGGVTGGATVNVDSGLHPDRLMLRRLSQTDRIPESRANASKTGE